MNRKNSILKHSFVVCLILLIFGLVASFGIVGHNVESVSDEALEALTFEIQKIADVNKIQAEIWYQRNRLTIKLTADLKVGGTNDLSRLIIEQITSNHRIYKDGSGNVMFDSDANLIVLFKMPYDLCFEEIYKGPLFLNLNEQ